MPLSKEGDYKMHSAHVFVCLTDFSKASTGRDFCGAIFLLIP